MTELETSDLELHNNPSAQDDMSSKQSSIRVVRRMTVGQRSSNVDDASSEGSYLVRAAPSEIESDASSQFVRLGQASEHYAMSDASSVMIRVPHDDNLGET